MPPMASAVTMAARTITNVSLVEIERSMDFAFDVLIPVTFPDFPALETRMIGWMPA